jgi:hypothetical protein
MNKTSNVALRKVTVNMNASQDASKHMFSFQVLFIPLFLFGDNKKAKTKVCHFSKSKSFCPIYLLYLKY